MFKEFKTKESSEELSVLTGPLPCKLILKRTYSYETKSNTVLQDTSSNKGNSETVKTAQKVLCSPPHKIGDSGTKLFSPTTAISHLKLDNFKKPSKSRRRLVSDNSLREKHLNGQNDQHQRCITSYFPTRKSTRKTKKTVLEEKQKQIEDAVLSNKEDGLQVQTFVDKGRGVVAMREFEKGDFIVEYAGELINTEVAQKRELIYAQDENTGCYMYYFKHKDDRYCIDATAETNRLGRLLNHSRNGNLCPKTIEINGVPRIVMIAKCYIPPGTELTYDYGDRSKKSLLYHPWLAQ